VVEHYLRPRGHCLTATFRLPCRAPGLPSLPVATMVAADQLLREPEPAVLPRGWRPCKACGLAVPVRETWCSLCLWERWITGKEAGWRCVQGAASS